LKTESAVQNPVPPQEGVAEAEVKRGISLIQLIKYGGIVGHSIILLSFIAVGLAIEYAFSIRHAKIAPPKDIAVIRNLISEHKIEVLKKLDQKKASYLTQVVIAGLHEVSLGYEVMIKAMEDASEALSAQIARKVEHLNVISNIAPMLGLLGTVTGMLRCFYTISQIRGSVEPQMLARGIFEALVTTVEGLIVAIPTLYLYAIFRNRVDECTGRASLIAEELLTSFKFENNQGQGE
jgi:biopolymer transport protein ExbB